MAAYYGYGGKVLKIDLCTRELSEYPWSHQDREKTLGGKMMAAQILRDHLTGKERAFSDENWVVITTGPLTGTGAPGSNRFDIATLSPKDDLPAFSNCGGDLGVCLKKAGYDALILSGRSQKKCWLEIREEQVIFHDGVDLWGTGTGQCQEKMAQLLGTGKFGRLCIGPAGENLVKFASVVGDGHSAGRAGIGAVLGSKNVKAITVTGSRPIELWDPEAVAEWNRSWHAQLRAAAHEREEGKMVCPSCPLHCSKHQYTEKGSVLDELGMDAIAAHDAANWAAEQGIPGENLYEDIAFRRGIGEKLAEGIPHGKGKGGNRRGGSNEVILEAFHLFPDDPETASFCRCLTDGISAAGQCIFTVNGLRAPDEGEPILPVLKMLNLVTGMEMDLEKFLRIGHAFSELVQQIPGKKE